MIRPKPKYTDPLAGIHRAVKDGLEHSLSRRGVLEQHRAEARRRLKSFRNRMENRSSK